MSKPENESKGGPKWLLDIDLKRDYQYLLVFAAKHVTGDTTPKIDPEYSDGDLIRLLDLTEEHIKKQLLPKLGEKFKVVKKMITPKRDEKYPYHEFPSRFDMAFRPGLVNTKNRLGLGFIEVVGEFLGAIEINLCNERVKAKQRRGILKGFLDIIEEDMQIPVDRNILGFADRLAFTTQRMYVALTDNHLSPKHNTFPPNVIAFKAKL